MILTNMLIKGTTVAGIVALVIATAGCVEDRMHSRVYRSDRYYGHNHHRTRVYVRPSHKPRPPYSDKIHSRVTEN